MNQDELIAQAEIGEEARKFIGSDLYKCMVGIASQHADENLIELERVDPDDSKKIRKLQDEIRHFRSFEKWLKELIDEGDNAISVFRQQRSN